VCSSDLSNRVPYSSAKITVSSAAGVTKNVIVNNVGLIYVQ
jgi:hypothetical protein